MRNDQNPGAKSPAGSPEDLLALRANDPVAVASLVRSETPRLLAVARRILRQEEDAKDAVPDALISALSSLDRFEGGSQLSTWLHRIVVNAALMKLRSRRARPEESTEELTTDETAQALSTTTTAVKVRLHRARQAPRGLLDPGLRA